MRHLPRRGERCRADGDAIWRAVSALLLPVSRQRMPLSWSRVENSLKIPITVLMRYTLAATFASNSGFVAIDYYVDHPITGACFLTCRPRSKTTALS
jgi:hypothetical protein